MRRGLRFFKRRTALPPVNFITLHYAYFVVVCLASSAIFYCSSTPAWTISYIDSLFLVISAMTEAGLNTVKLSQLTTWQQVLLWLLFMLGSTIWVSVWTVLARKAVFERRFQDIVRAGRMRRTACAARGRRDGRAAAAHVAFEKDADQTGSPESASASFARYGVGRNGQFHGLTREERERLGGCEYRALRVLVVLVPLYFFLWQLLGCLALGAWMAHNRPGPALRDAVNPWWLGVFNAVSAFNNNGMSLLDDNVIPFQDAHFVLVTMGLLILAGNTAYPVFLRLMVWSLGKLLALVTAEHDLIDLKETLAFMLQYPRRVYTYLFPARPTWWLVFMMVVLNSLDWISFEVLNLGNPVVEHMTVGSRVLAGLFQAIAVRSGGFYVVPIAGLYIGTQITYVIMMYISVYPVVITMRHSNVYEERSLGIYSDDPAALVEAPGAPAPLGASLGRALRRAFSWHGVGAQAPGGTAETHISFVRQQIHGQLAHDIWWLVLAVLVVSTIETANFLADPVDYSVFNVLFEMVSGYGTVGISIGLPGESYAFSGGWHAASKLVLCAVMLRGRHRGLPVALDKAVRLPGEQLHREEEEDFRIRRSMTTSRRLSEHASP